MAHIRLMVTTNTGLTLAHITHEAVEHVGGIGTVLQGLITSPLYQQRVQRTILIGPTSTQLAIDAESRLGPTGNVQYSSIDDIDRSNLGSVFRPIEQAFHVSIVYGKRHYRSTNDKRDGEAEILLLDVFGANIDRLNAFKLRLWQRFGLDSTRYEQDWNYEEYVRLAEPAYYALRSMLDDADLPCIVFAHEFMGIPTALATILEGRGQFHTVFHAHECATARRLVESHEGHEIMFYNVLDHARHQGQYVADVFGSQDHLFRHALISCSHMCDAIIAVGDRTRDELRFLGPQFDHKQIDLVYNGLPAGPMNLASKLHSRQMLLAYTQEILGYEVQYLMTHVTRPVISKGIWRDLKVCHELDRIMTSRGQRAVLFILTSAGNVRRSQDVFAMEQHYGWPRQHRQGYPDLVGPEIAIYHDVESFNAAHRSVQAILVNQFGWERAKIGRRLPHQMSMVDLRRATDVEFGMATYEPFGISPLEPLGAGAICVISNICGCHGFVRRASHLRDTPNVLCADFTSLDHRPTIEELKHLSRHDRDQIEQSEAERIATALMHRLPTNKQQTQALITSGQELVGRMGWDQVIESELMPMLSRISVVPGQHNGH